MIERAFDYECGVYASLSRAILEHIPQEELRDEEGLSRLLSQSHQYQGVSCVYTETPGALDHFKIMMSLILDRQNRWGRQQDAIQLADCYNECAMAYMRTNQEEEAISAWWKSYEAFGSIPGSNALWQEWPAVHLGILYVLRNEPNKGEELVMPILIARQNAFGNDDITSMV